MHLPDKCPTAAKVLAPIFLLCLVCVPVCRADGPLFKTLKNHTAQVWAVAFSPDGKTMVSSGKDTSIIVWDAEKFEQIKVLKRHTKGVVALAFSPNGKYLASGSRDNSIVIWNATTMQPAAALTGHSKSVLELAFSPDGRYFASTSMDNTVRIFRNIVFRPLKVISMPKNALSIAFSPDSKILATGHDDGTVHLYDTRTYQVLKSVNAHGDRVWAVAFSPDGKYLVSASDDATLKVWSLPGMEPVKTLSGHGGPVCCLAFSPDGKYLASGSSDKSVKIWQGGDFRLLASFDGHENAVNTLAFSIDGKYLVSGGDDNTVRIWQMPSQEQLAAMAPASSGKKIDMGAYRGHMDAGNRLFSFSPFALASNLKARKEFAAAMAINETSEAKDLAAKADAMVHKGIMQAGIGAGVLLLAGAGLAFVLLRARKRRELKQNIGDEINRLIASNKFEEAFELYGKYSKNGGDISKIQPQDLYAMFSKNETLDELLAQNLPAAHYAVFVKSMLAAGDDARAVAAFVKFRELNGTAAYVPAPFSEDDIVSLYLVRNDAVDVGIMSAPGLVKCALAAAAAGKKDEAASLLLRESALCASDMNAEQAGLISAAALSSGLEDGLLASLAGKKCAPALYDATLAALTAAKKNEQAIKLLEAAFARNGALSQEQVSALLAAHCALDSLDKLNADMLPAPSRSDVAAMLMEKGRNEDALKMLSKTPRESWGDREYSMCMELYIRMNVYDLAVEMLDSIKDKKTVADLPEFFYAFAVYSEEQGKLVKALQIYKDFMVKGVTHKDVVTRYPALRDRLARQGIRLTNPAPETLEAAAAADGVAPAAEPKAELQAGSPAEQAAPAEQAVVAADPQPETAQPQEAVAPAPQEQPEAAQPAPEEQPQPQQEPAAEPAVAPADNAEPGVLEQPSSPVRETPRQEHQTAPKAAAQPDKPKSRRLDEDSRRISQLKGGKMELLKEIGHGGMGIVYSVFDKSLNRKVALKRMRDELYLSNKEADKFLNEARMVAQLNHPNIVVVYEIIEQDDMAYILFEYIDGQSLEQMLENSSSGLPYNEVMRIVEQICNGLSYAHNHNVIHRDLKPSNIMLAHDGLVKITDFGIARMAKDTILRLTGASTGTLAYMAPEQELGTFDARSDIYSMGVLIYEMLTGELPFRGPNFYLQKEKMIFKPATELVPELPHEMNAIINRCLEADREKRYASVDELLRDMLGRM
jgi:WD40 repeat protein